MPRLDHDFYKRDARVLAKGLLGMHMHSMIGDVHTSGVIVETEAYLGEADKAAHTCGGRRTKRNQSMWGEGGLAYVYFTYGVHYCFNVVASEVDDPVAVLIRALQPLTGQDVMAERRLGDKPRKKPLTERDFCSGPGKLSQAMGIGGSHDGLNLVDSETLWIETPDNQAKIKIQSGPRIGIDYAEEWRDKPLRFGVRDSIYLSRSF